MKSILKIAMVGCGALGSYYGARLAQAGHSVYFLLRSDYEVVRRHGVHVHSVTGDFHAHPQCAQRPEDIGVAEVVLIGLKTTANQEFSRLLPPLVGPSTLVVTLQNGLGNEARLSDLLGPGNILCGLCFVCLNRQAPGLIQHSAHGHIVLGEFQRPPRERTRALARLFQQAGIPCEVTEDLERAHWEKLVWNVPFNGLGVAGAAGYDAVARGHVPPGAVLGACLPTDQLLQNENWRILVRELMLEVIHTANALGFPVPETTAELNIQRTSIMGAYQASTLVDFARGQPLEIDSLFVEPLRYAHKAGVPVPRLASLCTVLQALDPGRRCTDCRPVLTSIPAPLDKTEEPSSQWPSN